ncbi:hypothetical protein ZIOFF_021566 [Zingiber officinale]|uniref:Short-chain dehydrogenase TIC 32, chloroplastic n=1 Tax=Zingiber officinale TaxID=94328 RepID=A0A8J5LJN3_ZINOF|nr:hypothetical protein ZIOFF_021566 [Zingiber officinale]
MLWPRQWPCCDLGKAGFYHGHVHSKSRSQIIVRHSGRAGAGVRVGRTSGSNHATPTDAVREAISIALPPHSLLDLSLPFSRLLRRQAMGYFREATGIKGPSGFGSGNTAEEVTKGIDASHLTVIITGLPSVPLGGSSGIGAETARVLAFRGAHVIIGARNLEAANNVKQRILRGQISPARVDIIQIDVSSLRSVRAFADKFLAMDLPLNVLINNAGIMYCPFQLSEDGVEMQFATNHLGHFLLTNLLLEKMKTTAAKTGTEGRIVNLSSVAHIGPYSEGIKFDKLNDKKAYNDKLAYGQSKLANILHSNELARRLKAEGANVTANSVHPAVLKTVTCVLWKNIPQGAATSCYVAVHPNLKGVSGKYFADSNEEKPSNMARDAVLAKKLWDFSEQLVNSK